jgi:hypothetical protein
MNHERARRVHADVPHERKPAPWLDPLLLGSNAALFAVHLAVTPTSNLVFREPFVVVSESDRPIIYITWHRLNYVCMPMLLALPRVARPTRS